MSKIAINWYYAVQAAVDDAKQGISTTESTSVRFAREIFIEHAIGTQAVACNNTSELQEVHVYFKDGSWCAISSKDWSLIRGW